MHLTTKEIADRTARIEPTITNMIRLLRLPGNVQLRWQKRRLSMGHARAIRVLPVPTFSTACRESIGTRLFGTQVERLVKKINEPREPTARRWKIRTLRPQSGTGRHPRNSRRIVQKTEQSGA